MPGSRTSTRRRSAPRCICRSAERKPPGTATAKAASARSTSTPSGSRCTSIIPISCRRRRSTGWIEKPVVGIGFSVVGVEDDEEISTTVHERKERDEKRLTAQIAKIGREGRKERPGPLHGWNERPGFHWGR